MRDSVLDLIAIKTPLIVNNEIVGVYGMSYIKNTATNIFNLTKRELEIAKHLIRGKTAKENAKSLLISNRTIEHHIANLKAKTNCKSRADIYEIFKSNHIYLNL